LYRTTKKKLNEYAANVCLGYAYLMLKDWKNAIEYLNRAIKVFPLEKKDWDFNPNECYNTLSSIYYATSDTLNFRRIINKKIADEPIEKNTTDDLMSLACDYFLEGNIGKAEDYCKKVREINPDHFDALSLLSHINYLKGSKLMSQFQIGRAGRYIRDNDDYYKLSMQAIIYQINDGNIQLAKSNIEKAKQILGQDNCALCDTLLTDYCTDKQ